MILKEQIEAAAVAIFLTDTDHAGIWFEVDEQTRGWYRIRAHAALQTMLSTRKSD